MNKKHANIFFTIFAFVSLALFSGCKTADEIETTELPPSWVTGKPRIEGMICAVGISEPTFYKDEGRIYAAEDARKELARTVSVKIRTIMIDIASEKGSEVDEATVTEVSSWASEAVVKNSQIMGYWFDAEGLMAKKNVTYVNVCMPKKFNKDDLSHTLQGSAQSVRSSPQEINRTADEIINKLIEER